MRHSQINDSDEDLELRAAGYAILMAMAAVVFVVAAGLIGVFWI